MKNAHKNILQALSKLIFILLLSLSILAIPVYNNNTDEPVRIDFYEFINYKKNVITFFNDSSAFENIFTILNAIILKGEGILTIAHIGDSHVQADFFPGRIRSKLQTFFQGALGSRGFVFPYSVAQTNNPITYSQKFTGKWNVANSIYCTSDCPLGISGMSITTYDSLSSITFIFNSSEYPSYDFNLLKIFHPINSSSFSVKVSDTSCMLSTTIDSVLGYTKIKLSNYFDSISLVFQKTNPIQKYFTLHGISFENDNSGITYHSFGVNGAKVNSFLRCQLLPNHLKALSPNLVIVSLGANDSYVTDFDEKLFEAKYDSLLLRIKTAIPKVAILLTTPGDCYRYNKVINTNVLKVNNVIFQLAKKHQCAVWDFFTVMGGLNSIDAWKKADLTAKDRLHLNKQGYLLQGDLLFNAFIKSYDNFINATITK